MSVDRAPRGPGRARPARAAAAGFTLIELMAVLVIFGLLATIALPNLGLRDSRLLDDDAKQLANGLEFARARAVMTAVPHRVLLDLDHSAWRIEAYSVPGGAAAADVAPAAASASAAPGPPALVPPAEGVLDFAPLPGTLGDDARLDPRVGFAYVETPDGRFEEGLLQIVFEGDGTSEPAIVALQTQSGSRVVLQVAPLADTVRFEHDDDR